MEEYSISVRVIRFKLTRRIILVQRKYGKPKQAVYLLQRIQERKH